MKKSKSHNLLLKFSVVFVLIISMSCSSSDDGGNLLENNDDTGQVEEETPPVTETPTPEPEPEPMPPMVSENCQESSFPNLGPRALSAQTCTENTASTLNIGTLDCRSTADFGGYQETGGYGRYRITGSLDRFDGTRTRVERFFNRLARNTSTSSTLHYNFIIDNVSSGLSCIVQSHATGEILAGADVGKQAASAVFLLYVGKTNTTDANGNEIYELQTHESTKPFTTEGRGERTRVTLGNITQGVEYNLSYETGYDNDKNAFSIITISLGDKILLTSTLNHTYTTEAVTTRYGAYEACDVCEDDQFQIRIRNVSLCRKG